MKKLLLLTFTFYNLFAFDMVAHRGYYKEPENSLQSVIAALKKGYDGVEIDIWALKSNPNNQDYGLCHDGIIKREIAIEGKKSFYTVNQFTKAQWKALYKKNPDGTKSKYKATALSDVLDAFRHFALKNQYLNIEIKSKNIDINSFYNKIKPYEKQINLQVSSLHVKVLEDLRKLDKNLYLGYIFLPNKNEVKNKIDKRVSALANRYGLGGLKEKYEDTLLKKYDSISFTKQIKTVNYLKNRLGENFGLHLDFQDVKEHLDDLLKLDKNIKIYIYSLSDTDPNKIARYFKKFDIGLNGVITNMQISR